jgi:hypothetical protein
LDTTDAYTAAQTVNVYDSNGLARAIQSWERLCIDSIDCDVDASAERAALLDLGSGTATTSGQLLASFAFGGVGEFHVDDEGINVSVGTTPTISAQAAGGIHFIANARVVNGKSQGVRPFYRELLTPGGNVGGQ